jgi:hypothetical protein
LYELLGRDPPELNNNSNKLTLTKMEKFFILALFAFYVNSCYPQSCTNCETKDIFFDVVKTDSIIVFKTANGDTIPIFRELEIIETNLVDTITIGFAVVNPKFKKFIFSQNGLNEATDQVYIDRRFPLNDETHEAFAKFFTISKYKRDDRRNLGTIKLRVKLKKQNF